MIKKNSRFFAFLFGFTPKSFIAPKARFLFKLAENHDLLWPSTNGSSEQTFRTLVRTLQPLGWSSLLSERRSLSLEFLVSKTSLEISFSPAYNYDIIRFQQMIGPCLLSVDSFLKTALIKRPQ